MLELFTFNVATALILVGICAIYLLFVRRGKRLPPGPPGYPLIGNILDLDPRNMISQYQRLREEYGDVFCLKLFHRLSILVNGREAITELFVKHADAMSDRPDNLFAYLITQGLGIVSTSGALWKEHRAFSLTTLRNFGFGKRCLENQIREEVELFLNDISSTSGKPFDIQDLLMVSISNVICSLAFGRHYDHDDERLHKLLAMINAEFATSGGLMNIVPALRHIPGDPFGAKIRIERMQKVLNFLREIVDEHRNTFDEENIRDYIDAFLAEQKRQADITDSTFTDDQLLQTLRDFFVAGSDTTAATLRWAALFIVCNPGVQSKMRQEIERVVGSGRFPSMEDKTKLPYCEAVILETQRLGNIAPFAVPHMVKYDVQWNGYTIPKGALIRPSLWSVAMDPEVFPDPDQFDPTRFIDENGKVTGHNRILPFSIGRRICLGESLAKMELFLFLTSLIQHYELLPENSTSLPDLQGVYGQTYSPKPFKIRTVPVK